MSIERQFNQLSFLCDGSHCNECFEPDSNNFSEAIEKLKEVDWSVRYIKGEWLHICPDCQAEETRNALAL